MKPKKSKGEESPANLAKEYIRNKYELKETNFIIIISVEAED